MLIRKVNGTDGEVKGRQKMIDASKERPHIIEVKGLTKVFNGKVKAVNEISFYVEEGEILGFLGPNGAGKTTTLNILSTLLRPTSGTAIVNGYDILEEPDGVRRSLGFVFQDPTLDVELTGRENLDFHGRIYGLKRDVRQKRINELLDVIQLTDRSNDFVKTYSGGMKRRMEIARGLLHRPKVLFLDEPTLGLDPQTRRAIWDYIRRLNQKEKITIILTTHYTEEADYLCNRIQIIDRGSIVAQDTPAKLKARLEGDVVSLFFESSGAIERIRSFLEEKEWIRRMDVVESDANQAGIGLANGMPQDVSAGGSIGGIMPYQTPERIATEMGASKVIEPGSKSNYVPLGSTHTGASSFLPDSKRLNLLVDNGGHRIPEIVKLIDSLGVVLESVELHKPSLDDVFLSVTGRTMRDERGSHVEEIRRRRIIRQARGQRTRV